MSGMSDHRGHGRPHLFGSLEFATLALRSMWRDPVARGPLLLVISLLIAGTVFYTLVEGWTIIDALYFCAMSLGTVGYGDVVHTTDVGKLFTTFYVLIGIGILVAFFTTLTAKVLALQTERRRERGLID
jgi:voltage-gated potassium channel